MQDKHAEAINQRKGVLVALQTEEKQRNIKNGDIEMNSLCCFRPNIDYLSVDCLISLWINRCGSKTNHHSNQIGQ